MKIVAKTTEGQEFMYNYASAHAVPERSAAKICDLLNQCRYMLKGDAGKWFVYEVGSWDCATVYAEMQSFYIRNGSLKRRVGK